ncbi:DUF3185 family protein [Cohnella sp. AR92]|uniref:TRADD-N-associated membrane domain-containing protein n=1 Tax=Cohnella sp. AR92 TaxID=648716 RepID=UPI000F8D315A|nr:DUF3185 family protein [Cohnella sp. AR92]RUS48726.1 DUF3185 family protein [Cohnella sp. AR92]
MKSNPLQVAVLGLMVLIFGIIDILMVNPTVGIVLTVAGAVMTFLGWNRHQKSKKAAKR